MEKFLRENMLIQKTNLKKTDLNTNIILDGHKNQGTNIPNNSIQKSLYTQKGVYIPFCGLAKGQDFIEETCIHMLRKVREHRFRKFDENDIREIITSLKKVPTPEEKPHIIQEALILKDESTGENPPKSFVKKVINLIAGKPEDDRFAILEFAQQELNKATHPLFEFSQIPENNQTKLIKILKKINNTNETALYKNSEAQSETVDSIYDIFRTVVYAHNDLHKMNTNNANSYKLETLKLLYDDKKYMKNLNTYSNENAKIKIIEITDNIINYFIENIL